MQFEAIELPGATFGGLLTVSTNPADMVLAAEALPDALPNLLDKHQGLLLIKCMDEMADEPELLLRLSRIFGTEVESYHETRMARQNVHPEFPEIFMVSNIPPSDRTPPPQPNPSRNKDGSFPRQFPTVVVGIRIRVTVDHRQTYRSFSAWWRRQKAKPKRFMPME